MELCKDKLIFELRVHGKEVGTDGKRSGLLALVLANINSLMVPIDQEAVYIEDEIVILQHQYLAFDTIKQTQL